MFNETAPIGGHLFAVTTPNGETFTSSVTDDQVKAIRGLLLQRGAEITLKKVVKLLASAGAYMAERPTIFATNADQTWGEYTTEVLTGIIEKLTTNDFTGRAPSSVVWVHMEIAGEDTVFAQGAAMLKEKGLKDGSSVRRGNFGAAIGTATPAQMGGLANGSDVDGTFQLAITPFQVEFVTKEFSERGATFDRDDIVDIIGQVAWRVSRAPEGERHELGEGETLSDRACVTIKMAMDQVDAAITGNAFVSGVEDNLTEMQKSLAA